MSEAAVLEVRDLHKVFERSAFPGRSGRRVHAVRGVSFRMERGVTLGIVGESGSGKSTLARAILQLDPPSEGTVRFNEREVTGIRGRDARDFRRQVQIVFQDPNSALEPRWRVERSIDEALRLRGLPREERSNRIDELLELVGLSPDRRKDYPHQFSGGQKQRIVIARALAVEPALLVLDEPVSSLDVSIQAQILNLLVRIKEEFSLSYLFISHDLNLVGYFCDEIGVMRRGELVELAPTETLLSAPRHEYTKELFGASPRFADKRVVSHDFLRRKR
jgi:peptide/nickel transport system ATP-binding protein/oligopeptide transport system ATP-binding protein